MQCFLNIAQQLAKPEMFQTSTSLTFQMLPQLSWLQPPVASAISSPPPAPTPQIWAQQQPLTNLSSEAEAFLRKPPVYRGTFCTQSGHTIHSCPGAIDYVNAGHGMVKNGDSQLPKDQPTPNDISKHSLKHSIDTWPAVNSAHTSDIPAQVTSSHTALFQRDALPRATLDFEATRSKVHISHIRD